MKIKHLLENKSDTEYYSNIIIRNNSTSTSDQIYESLYEVSIDADFELKGDYSGDLHYQSRSNNLRVLIKRTMFMINAIRSIKEIKSRNLHFSILRDTPSYRLFTVTKSIAVIEKFLQLNYTTEEQLLSISK